MRTLQVLLVVAVAALMPGCVAIGFFLPTKGVPKVPATTVPDSALVDVDLRVEQVRRSGMRKTGKGCTSDGCWDNYEKKSWLEDVDVANASVDGRPVSIGEVATASADFVREDQDTRAARSACTRGKATIGIGVLAALAGAYLLQKAEDNNGSKTPGYGAVGGGIGVMAAGYLFFGYRRCDDWIVGQRKWKGVYEGPTDTEVRGDRAQLLKKMADQVNATRAKTSAR